MEIENRYGLYDQILECLIIRIRHEFNGLPRICLFGFNAKDKGHLLVLYEALTVAKLFDKEVVIEGSYFDYRKAHRIGKKQKVKVRRMTNLAEKTLSCGDAICEVLAHFWDLGKAVTANEIYDLYFEKGAEKYR